MGSKGRAASVGNIEQIHEDVVVPPDLLHLTRTRRDPGKTRWSSIAAGSSSQPSADALAGVGDGRSYSVAYGPQSRLSRASGMSAPRSSSLQLGSSEPTKQVAHETVTPLPLSGTAANESATTSPRGSIFHAGGFNHARQDAHESQIPRPLSDEQSPQSNRSSRQKSVAFASSSDTRPTSSMAPDEQGMRSRQNSRKQSTAFLSASNARPVSSIAPDEQAVRQKSISFASSSNSRPVSGIAPDEQIVRSGQNSRKQSTAFLSASNARPISGIAPDEKVWRQSHTPSIAFATPDEEKRKSRPKSYGPPNSFRDFAFGAEQPVPDRSNRDSRNRSSLRITPVDEQPERGKSVVSMMKQRVHSVGDAVRNSSVFHLYERAKTRGAALQRARSIQILFEYGVYALVLAIVYFVFVGVPLWNGAVWWLYWVVSHKFVIAGGWSITIGIGLLLAFSPLLILFEKEPPPRVDADVEMTSGVADTALLIPCYKSAGLIANTLEAALMTFPASHIFVIANGNSPTPIDDTEDVCRPYGVNHIWSPVGSKIVAQFVGSYAAKGFKNVLLIDDDCALPSNFPVVSERLTGQVECVGYTIKSVGPNSSKGTFCQQAQDFEYKLSGLQRAFSGKIGSATFPHGAISLWDREFLTQTFHHHTGFTVSEDWFFGHSCRCLGGRVIMCSSVFVETETPPSLFWGGGGASRGGFGEMTVFKQRFVRWNFFFVAGIWYNMKYILFSWKLGWWELGAKCFVFQEVYECLLYLLTPFMLPISLFVRPAFCGYLIAATLGMYFANCIIFNEVHLRLRKERVSWAVLVFYYMPYKFILTLINVASCYWSIFKYARYFARRHLKIVEDEAAVEIVLRMAETKPGETDEKTDGAQAEGSRRMTITAVPSKRSSMRVSVSR